MTKKGLVKMMRAAEQEETLSHVGWAFGESGGKFFAGCAVGNFLWRVSGKRASRSAVDYAAGQIASSLTVNEFSPRTVRRNIADGKLLAALSQCFEGGRPSFERFVERIERFFPDRMMIEIGGIRPMLARGRKKAAKKAGR